MSVETIKSTIDVEEYFRKMKPENSAIIAAMCVDKLTRKVEELNNLYTQLVKTYSIEMVLCDITLLVQLSSPILPDAVQSILGTSKGIGHAVTVLMKEVENIEKEEKNS